jgi:hypothetical protein
MAQLPYAMILGIGSYLLATSSTFGCYLATTGFVLIDESPRQYFDMDVERMAVGLFSFEDRINASELTCTMYSRSQIASFDAAFTVAQAFVIKNGKCHDWIMCDHFPIPKLRFTAKTSSQIRLCFALPGGNIPGAYSAYLCIGCIVSILRSVLWNRHFRFVYHRDLHQRNSDLSNPRSR